MRVSSYCLAGAVAVSSLLPAGCEEPSLGAPSGRVVVRHGPGTDAPAVAARLLLAANRRTDALFNAGGGIDRIRVTRDGVEIQSRASWRGPTLVEVSFDDAPQGGQAIYSFQGLTAEGRAIGASRSIALATGRTLGQPVLLAAGTASAAPTLSWSPVAGAQGYFLEFAAPEGLAGTRVFMEAASTSYRYGEPASDAFGERTAPASLDFGGTYSLRLGAYSVAGGNSSYGSGDKVYESVSPPVSVAPRVP